MSGRGITLLAVIFLLALSTMTPALSQETAYSIRLYAESGTLCAGGDEMTITATLFENGVPYSGPRARIYFSSSEPQFADVDREEAYTDANGNVTFRVKTKDVPGTTVVSAHYFSVNRKVLAEKGMSIEVKALGTVSGTIYDKDGKPVSGVNVTLSNKDGLVNVKCNPQRSGEVIGSAPGTYVFEGVRYGEYVLHAELNGTYVTENVTVVPGAMKADMTMKGYTSPTPTPPPAAQTTGDSFPGNMMLPLVSCGLGILVVFSIIVAVTLIFKDKK